MGLEIPHLETFCKAAELLNFTAAAEALCMTQAAVSQRIRALEEELRAPLFERHAGRVSLTAAGRRLYEYAQHILALHQQARQELGEKGKELTGELHLAASTVPAEHLMPAILQTFQQKFPKVHVMATMGDSAAVLSAVEQGKATLALVGRRGPAEWADSRPFARDRLFLVMPPGHRWKKRKNISLEELAKEPLVLRETGSGSRACLEDGLAQVNLTPSDLNITLELGSNEAIKQAVLRGAGVALLSAFAVREDLHAQRLLTVPVVGLDCSRDLYLVTDKRRVLPPPARAFLEVVEASPFESAYRRGK